MNSRTYIQILSLALLPVLLYIGYQEYQVWEAKQAIAVVTHRLYGCDGGPCYTNDEMEAWIAAHKKS